MRPSKFHYTDTRSFLKANNYRLKGDEKGFSLYRDKDFVAEMKMGPFSAPFLNAWVGEIESRVTPVAVGFDKIHPKDMQGCLARFSSRFNEELLEKKMIPEQADNAAIDLFLSDEIVTDGDNSIFKVDLRTIKALPRVDFEVNGAVSFEDESEDEDSDCEESHIKAEKEKKVPLPFYHVIAMEKKGRVLDKLPKIWQKKIKDDGLSWEFEDGKLYVSNTIGAAYGLPPAPQHLWGLPKLQVHLDNWATTGVLVENEPRVELSTSDKVDRPAVGDAEWEKITEQFMHDPCWATFETFKTAECIERAYGDVKDDKRYRMGSNKNPLTASIRKVIRGEENAISWTDFSSLLDKTAKPNDTKGIMVLLYKFRLYVEQTKDGRVFVEK